MICNERTTKRGGKRTRQVATFIYFLRLSVIKILDRAGNFDCGFR
jgi:hypothetical protein